MPTAPAWQPPTAQQPQPGSPGLMPTAQQPQPGSPCLMPTAWQPLLDAYSLAASA